MDIHLNQEAITGLVALTVLEIVLGIDNIIFISILADKTPKEKQKSTRQMGLMIGMVVRILLLLCVSWIVAQDKNILFSIAGHHFTLRSLVLTLGGLFLLYQSVHEIHLKMKGPVEETKQRTAARGFAAIVLQMVFLNVVFSLDSVITAIGMADQLWVMITAVVLSMVVMLAAAGPIATFVNKNPGIKVLALSFLVLIGVSLIGEGFDQHIEKGYVYFSMAFAFVVELVNMRVDRKSKK
ncbi:MAG: TerC family protein [Bacteroidetes bacterium]|nr:TerC family protein [Bacteroidota bacterium]